MKKQSGFTLIEMVVVMVILGILAAVALPKFVNMTGQARLAKMQGAVGAVNSSIALVHAKWLAQGSPSTGNVVIEGATLAVGTDIDANGYPVPAAFQNSSTSKNIAGLDSNFNTATSGTIADASKSSCSFTITASTDAGLPPAVDTTALTEANCQ